MSAELEKLLDQTRDALISGDFSDLERFAAAVETLTISLPQLDRPMAERLRRYSAIGVNQIQIRFRSRSAAELCDQIDRFGAEVAPHLQS